MKAKVYIRIEVNHKFSENKLVDMFCNGTETESELKKDSINLLYGDLVMYNPSVDYELISIEKEAYTLNLKDVCNGDTVTYIAEKAETYEPEPTGGRNSFLKDSCFWTAGSNAKTLLTLHIKSVLRYNTSKTEF